MRFEFEVDVAKDGIYSYLKNGIFKDKPKEELEELTRLLIKEKHYVSLIKIKSADLLVGWMAVIFNPRDQLFRTVADILHISTFMKAPSLQGQIVRRFVSMGYGLIKEGGVPLYEDKHLPTKSYQLISIEWRINQHKHEQVKQIVRDHLGLKHSRLLKYYTYSPQTKYHSYCRHSQNHCRLDLRFEWVARMSIEGKLYFKVKCDKIERIGPVWKIQHHLNPLHILVASSQQYIL